MSSQAPPETRRAMIDHLARLPYWLLLAALLGIWMLWSIRNDESYSIIFDAIRLGIPITIYVTVVSYIGALVVGLLVGLARLSRHRVIYEIATFYVEIVRGVPMLVLLFYIAFVGAPGLVDIVNWMGVQLTNLGLETIGAALANFGVRDLSFTTRAILALVIGYSAFVAEIFRAGIQSIDRGQSEAALSLGMSSWQAMRYIILPQAVRRVLPPLGNDLVAMLKDSALVSVLGVKDITLQGKVYAASTFLFFETYNVVAFLYLIMTIGLALVTRLLESRMKQSD